MKYLLLFFLIILSACQSKKSADVHANSKSLPVYAKRFYIEEKDSQRTLVVTRPWAGSTSELRTRLVPRGKKKSKDDLEIPLRKVAVISTTHLALIEAAGAIDCVAAVSELDHVFSKEVRRRAKAGMITEVGDGGKLNLEKIASLKLDAVITYGLGDPGMDQHELMRAEGIPAVLLADYMEEEVLGRAEWIKAIGILFGKEKEADKYFEAQEKKYILLKEFASSFSNKPNVLLNAPWNGIWFAPGGQHWMAKLVKDAGAVYLFENNPSKETLHLDIEAVLEPAMNSGIWISSDQSLLSINDLLTKNPRFKKFSSVKNKNVWVNNAATNGAGGNDLYESAAARPADLLEDFIHIIHNTSNHTNIWYRKLN